MLLATLPIATIFTLNIYWRLLITPLEAQLLLISGSRELTDVLDGSKCCISLDSVNSADVSTESCWLCVCS
uniref:Uncharacterized protein n=1 Tax=Glossina palpalis gambiensis TaxID=67801 RepID=A0A1B0BV78_9MUSC